MPSAEPSGPENRWSTRELDAAGIHDPRLRASYARCRRLLAEHGRTYHLATLLLPPAKRPYLQAIYGFARYVDDMVDRVDVDADRKAAEFARWSGRVLPELRSGHSDDPVAAALAHTLATWAVPVEHVEVFLAAMRSDLSVQAYATYGDLERYMYGAAATLGLQMTPVLEPRSEDAYGPMRSMGLAFQLTNILRDVGADLDLGRLYLPAEDLRRFDVAPADLARRAVTAPVRELVRFEIRRTRELYRHAHGGLGLLHPSGRETIRTSLTLYAGILDAIEAADYDVLTRRARVGIPRRLRVAVPAYVRARTYRR